MSTQVNQSGFGTVGEDNLYDFSSPFFTVALVTLDEDRIPLWEDVNPDKKEGAVFDRLEELGLRSFPYASAVTIYMKQGGHTTIEATLDPTYEDGLRFVSSPLIEIRQHKMQVQFGYFGGTPKGAVMSPVFEGLVGKPEISLGDTISITLRAVDSVSSAMMRQEGSLTRTASRLDLIKEIIRGPDNDNPRPFVLDASEALKDDKSKGRLEEEISFTQRHLTDYQAVTSLCRQSRCHIYETPDRTRSGDTIIKLIPTDRSLRQPPKAVLALMGFETGDVGPFSRQYPILSVSTDAGVLSNPGGARAIRARSVSSKDREEVSHEASDETVGPSRVGPADGKADVEPTPENPGIDPETGDGGGFYHGDVEDPDTVAEMEAEFEGSLGALGLKVEIETLGMPDLFPRDVIQVRGLGEKMDYNYAVHEVVHTLDSSGFSTRITAQSNVLALDRGLRVRSEPNTLDAQDQTDEVEVTPEEEAE